MKKIILVVLAILCMSVNAYADPVSSGVTVGATGISIVYNGPCLVVGVSTVSDGTNDCQTWLLDSGVTKFGQKVDASVKPSERDIMVGVPFTTDLRLWHVGTGCQMFIEYIPR